MVFVFLCSLHHQSLVIYKWQMFDVRCPFCTRTLKPFSPSESSVGDWWDEKKVHYYNWSKYVALQIFLILIWSILDNQHMFVSICFIQTNDRGHMLTYIKLCSKCTANVFYIMRKWEINYTFDELCQKGTAHLIKMNMFCAIVNTYMKKSVRIL